MSVRDDEIERLQGERQNCPPVSESEYVRRLEDEIERLQDELQTVHAHLRHVRTEIERLRALKTPASAQLLNITKAALESAEAEIERRREEQQK